MKDSYSIIDIENVQAPIVVDAHTDDADIDLAGYNSALMVFTTGAGTIDSTANRLDVRISHADDDGTGSAGDYAYVETKDILGTDGVTDGVIGSLGAIDSAYSWGYVGGKRFLKIELREPGVSSVIVGIHVIKGHPIDAPITA